MWSRTCRTNSCRRTGVRVVVLFLRGIEQSLERRLRVDDDVLAAREPHDEVGAEQAVLVGRGGLLEEVAMVRASRRARATRFNWISPHRPRTCGARSAVTSPDGLLAEALLGRTASRSTCSSQLTLRTLTGSLERQDVLVEPLERVLDRLDLGGGDVLDLPLGEIEEGRRRLLQRLGRERLERGRELVSGAPLRGQPLAQDEPDGEAAEDRADDERCDHHRSRRTLPRRRTAPGVGGRPRPRTCAA